MVALARIGMHLLLLICLGELFNQLVYANSSSSSSSSTSKKGVPKSSILASSSSSDASSSLSSPSYLHPKSPKAPASSFHGSIDISANDPNESTLNLNDRYNIPNDQKPNFLIILADDLGHGDTSVKPFVGSGIKTPHLEQMAAEGLVMTNFHAAAATCTPTRASLLTGMNPWRLGLKVKKCIYIYIYIYINNIIKYIMKYVYYIF